MSGSVERERAGSVGAGAVRVSDAEREQVASRLAAAHAEGRLTLAEFDERVRSAHGAVVRADLDPLLADLPATGRAGSVASSSGPSSGPIGPGTTGERRRHHGPTAPFAPAWMLGGPCAALGLRASVAAWATASLVNLVIWVAVVAGTGTLVHPWWIWVAGPWGLVLLARVAARRAAPARTG
jgi:hypothetical protein